MPLSRTILPLPAERFNALDMRQSAATLCLATAERPYCAVKCVPSCASRGLYAHTRMCMVVLSRHTKAHNILKIRVLS